MAAHQLLPVATELLFGSVAGTLLRRAAAHGGLLYHHGHLLLVPALIAVQCVAQSGGVQRVRYGHLPSGPRGFLRNVSRESPETGVGRVLVPLPVGQVLGLGRHGVGLGMGLVPAVHAVVLHAPQSDAANHGGRVRRPAASATCGAMGAAFGWGRTDRDVVGPIWALLGQVRVQCRAPILLLDAPGWVADAA